jgi:dTDP-4-amino-4,6-dideoxygalactose transaminase
MSYVLLKDLTTRTRLIAHLEARGIHSVFHYVPLHSSPAGRKFGRAAGPMTVTDGVSERLLRLPLYYDLTEAEVAGIVAVIAEFFDGRPA